jgi:tetratricopeptide (TPR) repeat protein
MKKSISTLVVLVLFMTQVAPAQKREENSAIDLLLVRGDYQKVVDTCRVIITADSLNAEGWYKMGLAYQNLLSDDKSFDCFSKAASIEPGNSRYNFMLARAYSGKGKSQKAKPLLEALCTSDTLNWTYAFYLTGIYMQEGKYDESIKIYSRFYTQDTTNYVFLDKSGFAFLRKGEFETAIDLYNKSLAINPENTNALKNLSYLYASTYRADTAIKLLTRAMETDPEDMDLYVRRGGLHYLINYNKRALNDYLKVLSSGDSATLYLKRAGIGYTNNLQPKEAVVYLLKAYNKDSNDYETTNYLGRNYNELNDTKNSIYYYKRTMKILAPAVQQTSIASVMLAESQKKGGLYKEAIETYLSALKTSPDISLYMIIANLYDEKLKDPKNAIYYYNIFLEKLKTAKMNFKSDYIESISKRVVFLKEEQKKASAKPPQTKPK